MLTSRPLTVAVGIFLCGLLAGCSPSPAACPCFHALLSEGRCAASGDVDLGFPLLRRFAGRVLSAGEPVPDLTLALQPERLGPVRLVTTGEGGRFDGGELEPGDYRYVVCRPGFPGATGWFRIGTSGPEAVDLELPTFLLASVGGSTSARPAGSLRPAGSDRTPGSPPASPIPRTAKPPP